MKELKNEAEYQQLNDANDFTKDHEDFMGDMSEFFTT